MKMGDELTLKERQQMLSGIFGTENHELPACCSLGKGPSWADMLLLLSCFSCV